MRCDCKTVCIGCPDCTSDPVLLTRYAERRESRIRDLEAQLAEAKANVTASQRSDMHYRRNAEVAFAQRKEELAASESAHAETRREWYAAVGRAQESYTELENDMKAHLRAAQGEIDASVAREAETWRMVDALIEGIANAPGRLPFYIQEPRDALLAARAERDVKPT